MEQKKLFKYAGVLTSLDNRNLPQSFFFFFLIVYVGLLNYDKSNNHNYFGKTLIVQHDCSVILHKSNLFIPIML